MREVGKQFQVSSKTHITLYKESPFSAAALIASQVTRH